MSYPHDLHDSSNPCQPRKSILNEIFWFPLRVLQMAVVAAFMFAMPIIISFFDKIDLPVPDRRRDHHSHEYRAPRDNGEIKDYRSPCPALNTLANHGYLPRHGRDIKPYQFIQALQDGYNLSYSCAAFLTWGSFMLLSQWRMVSLKDIGRHNCVEHDASLLHRDPVRGKEYAPHLVDPHGMQILAGYAGMKRRFTAEDLATARVDREKEYLMPLDNLHATIARGEISLSLLVFGDEQDGEKSIPLERLEQWWNEERFPTGWKATRRTSLLQMLHGSKQIEEKMNNVRRERQRS